MKKKKKKRNRSHHSHSKPSSTYQPLTDSEAQVLREDIKSDFRKSKAFGNKEPLLVEVPGKEKMSEVLIDFARPFLDKYGKETGTSEKILAMAVVGWNIALVPARKKRALIAGVLSTLPASQRSTAEALLGMMEERKRSHFNEIKRYIVNYKVRDSVDSINVYVASTPSPDQMAEIRKNSDKLIPENSEAEKSGGTKAQGNDKPSVDSTAEHNNASPQENVPTMRRSGAFRLMLSKLLSYFVHRRGM
jgi:hypothetical protein